ncbi:flagellar motor protein MotB [Neobacillus terrae]|uniref:flagellar motor protein MotB n=1 Tax=Neobacillus terrae TaxID=3034837 RepID=UPI00140CD201|nr:flagellar motor protein MotB [Neobacillus terrae]NHM31500.1 flagellar motor protein MotB [Neobacillus terrae]
MSRRRKKKHHEDHMDESWLIPYADLLTLLLALFIVLFAMSSIDAQKFQLMSKAFNEMFTGGTGLMDFSSAADDGALDKPNVKKQETHNSVSNKEQENAAKLRDQEELKGLQGKVQAYINQKGLTDKLQTSLTDEGLLISIRDNVLFNSGSADIRGEDIKTAGEIADLLIMDPPRNIIISGHTDNVPIKNSRYQSNWELSVMRAVSFMKIILQNEKLDPRWFSAKGFGEYQPVAPNNTPDGKARNRRVEILILPRSKG